MEYSFFSQNSETGVYRLAISRVQLFRNSQSSVFGRNQSKNTLATSRTCCLILASTLIRRNECTVVSQNQITAFNHIWGTLIRQQQITNSLATTRVHQLLSTTRVTTPQPQPEYRIQLHLPFSVLLFLELSFQPRIEYKVIIHRVHSSLDAEGIKYYLQLEYVLN